MLPDVVLLPTLSAMLGGILSVDHKFPSGPETMSQGLPAVLYSVKLPEVVTLAVLPRPVSVKQMRLSGPIVNREGLAPVVGTAYSEIPELISQRSSSCSKPARAGFFSWSGRGRSTVSQSSTPRSGKTKLTSQGVTTW